MVVYIFVYILVSQQVVKQTKEKWDCVHLVERLKLVYFKFVTFIF